MVGGGIYLLGLADVVYPLTFVQSFAFGSLISAVDPVATLAIFQVTTHPLLAFDWNSFRPLMLTQSWTCWCSVSQSWTTLSRSSWPRPLWRAVTRTWKIVPWSTKLAPALAGVVDTELLIFFCRSRVLFILIWCSTDSLFYLLTGFSWCSLALLGLELWWRCWVPLSWNTLIFTQIQGKLTTPFVTHYFKSEFPYSLEFGLMLCFTYVPYALAEVVARIEN